MSIDFLNLKPRWIWIAVLTGVLSAIFLTAGFAKLPDPVSFSEDIFKYRILDEVGSGMVAQVLPWLEITIGFLLWVRHFRLTASVLSVILMLLFSGVTIAALIRGLDISCGCFGKMFEVYAAVNLQLLLRQSIILMAAISLFLLLKRSELA